MWAELRQWFLDPHNLLLIAAPAAFAAGLLAGLRFRSRRDNERGRTVREGDKAFFKGVQYILSNDHDQAIEQFTKAVQVNSDTVETYVALGNLYRSKGDIDRAIRIRQNIILRPHIDEKVRLRALFDLGLDYRKGGFLDRALETFGEVLKKEPSNSAALQEVEKIYEDLRDWENAFLTRQKISKLSPGDHDHILAHHKAEAGKVYLEGGEAPKAKAAFKKALSMDSSCVDAYLHLGDIYMEKGDFRKAVSTWRKIVDVAPEFTFLAYRRLEGAYSREQNLKPVEEFLKECSRVSSDMFTRLALARYLFSRKETEEAVGELKKALEIDPAFWEARRLLGRIFLEENRIEEAVDAYRDLLEHLNVPYLEFQCKSCGYCPPDLQWQCPQCRTWDSITLKDAAKVQSQPQAVEAAPKGVPEGGG
ncbi:MAG: tetratricopeptide repeat protein [Desulfobacteraceae bacterium]